MILFQTAYPYLKHSELNLPTSEATSIEPQLHSRSKGELCAQLTESVHRARSALNEEREKSERLDRKLEAEGRAAKKGWMMMDFRRLQ